jgi:cbb3-type cytochrome oxidase maturation protein
MNVILYLLPLALALGGLGLAAFMWSLKSGQFDDLEGAAWRVVMQPDGANETIAPQDSSAALMARASSPVE